MNHKLSPDGYAQTKAKLENLQRRLADLETRTDLKPMPLDEVRRSYKTMMRQYLGELKLYDAERCQEPEKP